MLLNKINLNSDIAEKDLSFFETVDMQLVNKITSANLSCLYHGGSKDVVLKALSYCKTKRVSVGAHISFLDRDNFGRTKINWNKKLIQETVRDQLIFLHNLASEINFPITHVKLHGALSNMACIDQDLSLEIVDYLKKNYPSMILLAPALSELAKIGMNSKIPTALEIFADRTYEDDGTLTPRSISNSLITDPNRAREHVKAMLIQGGIISSNGETLKTNIHSVCVHSDTQNAVEIIEQICILLHDMKIQEAVLPDFF